MAPKGAILLVVLKNQCYPSSHLPGFSPVGWGGPSCTSLVICCGPSRHFPGFSTISWGEDLVQALWFCWSVFFARVLVEVQFLGNKFGLKGSTYTRENKVFTTVRTLFVIWISRYMPVKWLEIVCQTVHIMFTRMWYAIISVDISFDFEMKRKKFLTSRKKKKFEASLLGIKLGVADWRSNCLTTLTLRWPGELILIT